MLFFVIFAAQEEVYEMWLRWLSRWVPFFKRKRNKRRVLAAEERKMDPEIQPEGGKPESLELPNALASDAEGQVGSPPSVSRKIPENPHRKTKP